MLYVGVQDSMGMLIGKGGSGLRGMQEKSGVKVRLQLM